MFDVDKWQEIFDTIRKNKLRTFLTSFSVARGIFMLIVLLGSGEGLSNGIRYQFRDDATNSIWVRPGQTSQPYKGLQPGRQIQFTNEDHNEVESRVEGVEHITSRYYVRSPTVSYGTQSGSYNVRCVHPDHLYIENTIVKDGRFLNELDLIECRKVAAIGVLVEKVLFQGASAIGEYIKVNDVPFKVVGTFEDIGGENEMEQIYLPITTGQRTYNGANRIAQFMFTTGDASLEESEAMAHSIRKKLATHHGGGGLHRLGVGRGRSRARVGPAAGLELLPPAVGQLAGGDLCHRSAGACGDAGRVVPGAARRGHPAHRSAARRVGVHRCPFLISITGRRSATRWAATSCVRF